nr:reverse transcriptase zinc-binding domain-containing protein [Tanacetum cinerariifolium]
MNNARLASNMSVWEMIADNKWRWPVVWNLKYPILANINVPMLNSQKNDKTKWKDIKGNLIDYTSKATWEVINCRATEVNWNKVVWFSQCNPRMAFIMWVDIRRRLQTQDKGHLKKKMDNNSLSSNWDVLIDQNDKLFNNEQIDEKTMLKLITENIRLQLMRLKVKRSANVQKMAMEWESTRKNLVECPEITGHQ